MDNVNVLIDDKGIDISVEEKNVKVVVSGGRGPSGPGTTRLLYVVDLNKSGNFLGTITVLNTLINTTGITFTWSGNGTDAILSFSNNAFFAKLLSITFIRTNGENDGQFIYIDSGTIRFRVAGGAGTYRCMIEFYNF